MKIIKIVSIVVLLTFFVILLKELYFCIILPYDENGRYFDENNGIIYESSIIIYLFCLLILNILAIMFILFYRNIISKLKWK
jgi:hypothetical protein